MSDENIMGKRIKECREQAGLTQEELGEKLGLQRAAINISLILITYQTA